MLLAQNKNKKRKYMKAVLSHLLNFEIIYFMVSMGLFTLNAYSLLCSGERFSAKPSMYLCCNFVEVL